MPARSVRTRLLAATALLLAGCAVLTGCHDGQGVRDEGPSAVSRSLGRPCADDHGAPGRPAPRHPGTVQRSFCATSVAQ
ncbi:hypothetical protein [Streptomyces carpinensis]|uniref:Lipoprotein n=1 Tax=Streptomyces carpinensis TaxID=66369 RepID=A0ABV1WA99_9ACTN|nr:hypothetical protein [Streptomyces carpinensis]